MLGLAFVHMWIYCSTHRPSLSDDVSTMAVMYLVLSAALAVLAAVELRAPCARLAPGAVARVVGATDLVCASCMTACGVLLAVPLGLPAAGVTVLAASLGGLGVGWAYARWCEAYARLDIHVSAPLVLVTMAVGSVGKAVIDVMPGVPAAVALACLPAATFACMRRSLANPNAGAGAGAGGSGDGGSGDGGHAAAPLLYYNARTIGSLARLAAGVAVYSMGIGIIQSVRLETATPPVLAILVHHGSEVLIALLVLVLVTRLDRRLDFSHTWRVIAALIVTALILEPYIDPAALVLLLSLVRTAQTFLIVLLFLALADIARHSPYGPRLVFALGWIAYALPFALGKVAGDALVALGSDASFELSLVTWVLVIAALFLFDEASLGNRLIFAELNEVDDADAIARRMDALQRELNARAAGGAGVAGPSEAGRLATAGGEGRGAGGALTDGRVADVTGARCAALARACGLTPREGEILDLLARGRSKTHIAEAFFISENTVRNHVKHIYAKVDVHNRQELIDRIESTAI